jgi:hypothetical protein
VVAVAVLAKVALLLALVAQVVVVLVGMLQTEQAEPQTQAVAVVVVAQEIMWPVLAAPAAQASSSLKYLVSTRPFSLAV